MGSLISGPFSLHSDWIRSIAWSPDEKKYAFKYPWSVMTHAYKCRIITGSDDSKVKVVAVETGNVMYTMAFHRSWVRAVLSTQDHFISCSDDR